MIYFQAWSINILKIPAKQNVKKIIVKINVLL